MEKIQRMLSIDECSLILYKYLQQAHLRVESYQIAPLSEKPEGFLGEHFMVAIKYQNEGNSKLLRCFMKVLNGSMKAIFDMTLDLHAYEKEEFFYFYLQEQYDSYGIDASFAPQSYFCKPYLIVLEDMSIRGYRTGPKDNSLDIDHCKVALKTLARFHASCILYENEKSKEVRRAYSIADDYPAMFKDMMYCEEANLATDWLRYSMEGVRSLIELIPENHIKKDDFIEKLNTLYETAPDLMQSLRKYKCTTLHGDLWCNNFLFRYEDEMPKESVLLDYQFLKYGPPSLDVVHFIFCNTRKSFREKHFTYLVEYYYTCLSDCLSKIDPQKGVPKHEYLELCNKLQVITKLICLCDRCITFAPEDIVAESLASDEVLRKYLFEGRCEAILTCFKKGELYRELIEEDLLELRDMLFQNS